MSTCPWCGDVIGPDEERPPLPQTTCHHPTFKAGDVDREAGMICIEVDGELTWRPYFVDATEDNPWPDRIVPYTHPGERLVRIVGGPPYIITEKRNDTGHDSDQCVHRSGFSFYGPPGVD